MKYFIRKNPKITYNLNDGNSYIKKIEEKLKDQLNNYCVECGEENPEYISINNGIFICRECSQIHLKFPKNISKIRKNNIKALTLNEIQYLLCGGNRSLLNFICNEYPKLAELPSNILYRTQAMIYYRQTLQYLINGCIPPIKPSIKIAYTIPNVFDNNKNNNFNVETINNYGIGMNTNNENDNYFDTNNKFYKTVYNDNMKINNNHNIFSKKNNNKFTLNNTIGNNGIKYDNYIINRPKEVNFQNNNNIIIGSKMEIINNINKRPILHSIEKITCKKNKNIHEYINNLNINNNINADVYVRPKLILSHNVSKTCLINKNKKNRIHERKTSFEGLNKKYYYSQVGDIQEKSRIDSIQLNFSNDISNFKKKKLIKNLSHEIYKKSKRFIKTNKYLHKSFSQKIFNTNNSNNNYNETKKENKNSNISQTENNQYIPTKNFTINYNKIKPNKICITNNEEFQIVPRKKTIDITNNKNYNNNIIIKNDEKDEKSENYENSSRIKINIKVNKKEKIENKILKEKEKEIKNECNKEEKEIKKKDIVIKPKFELKNNENISNFVTKCIKNRILLRKNEKKNITINNNKEKDKVKDKEINNEKINNNFKKRNLKNSSQEQILKVSNKSIQIQTKVNDNKIEKKKVSIRNKYKGKTKNK